MNPPDPVQDILWGMWGQMGVRSVITRQSHIAIDPEPLILVTSWFAGTDRRLYEECVRWCATHATWVSKSRLTGLAKTIDQEWRHRFEQLATQVRLVNRHVRWVAATSKTVTDRTMNQLALDADPIPFSRPSLLRFRIRAVAGVGARADVLAHLILSKGVSFRASQMHHLGYRKTTVAPILNDFADVGHLERWKEHGSFQYQFHSFDSWNTLFQSKGLADVDTMAIARVLRGFDAIAGLSTKSKTVAWVDGKAKWRDLQQDLKRLGVMKHDHVSSYGDLLHLSNALAQAWAESLPTR